MARQAWEFARNQHGVVSRDQLVAVGYKRHAIDHRIRTGRLYPLHRGIYAVGRPHVTEHGRWMAAVLACGDGAIISHSSAAALWRIGVEERDIVELSLPSPFQRRRPGLRVHRRPPLKARDLTREYGIPVTTPIQTLIDMSLRLDRLGVERMINEADRYNLAHPPGIRRALEARPGEPGVARLRHILDRRTLPAHQGGAGTAVPAAHAEGRPADAAHRPVRQRVRSRLLLAGARPGRRDRRPALPPHAG
jgi:Transcriptional regulator, AbiEi antitoxin